jgi:hypothetical protein
MKPDDPRVAAVAAAIVALLDGVTADAGKTVVDELVPITPEALAPRHLEHRSVVRLAEKGELRTIRIGRRRYTRASWLAELADKLPVDLSRPVERTRAMSKKDELIALLQGPRGRRRAVGS